MDKRNVLIGLLLVNQVVMYISSQHIAKAFNAQHRRYIKLDAMAHYLIDIVEENGIELSEFDKIALADIIQGET